MQSIPNLESFLEHLRLRGIVVGMFEIQNLQAVFYRSPRLTRIELLDIFQTVLAKDDKQRQIIIYLFEQLISYEDSSSIDFPHQRKIEGGEYSTNIHVNYDDKSKRKTSTKNFYILFFLCLIWLGFIVYYFGGENKISDLGLKGVIGFEASKKSSSIILFFCSIFCFIVLFLKTYKNTKVQSPLPLNINLYGRSFFPAMNNFAKNSLLSSKSRREIGLGVGYYIDEHLLNNLDVDRTVRGTAIRGIPFVYFKGANRQKEVWLWQDQNSSNSNLTQLADEINLILCKINVYVRRGYFHSLPSLISNYRGEIIWSAQHDYIEDNALILILCDGDSFSKMRNNWDDEKAITFQKLSQSSHLALVDCSLQSKEFCRIFKKYAIECLLPEEISNWINQRKTEYTIDSATVFDDLHRLAVACSLPSRLIMETEIRALHEVLQLNCIWYYSELRRYAKESGLGMDFSRSRYELLQDFSRMAKFNSQDFHKILDFWLKRNLDIDKQLCQQETLKRPWSNTRRQKQLELDIALLELWQSPEEAAEKIYSFFCSDLLKKEVEIKMNRYICKDLNLFGVTDESLMGSLTDTCKVNNVNYIELPFSWGFLSIKSQRQLIMSGFGGGNRKGFFLIDSFTQILFSILIGLFFASLASIFGF